MFIRKLSTLGLVASISMIALNAQASSHREAPAIAEDQFADNTDVYAFISPEDPNNVVFVANYVPLLIPSTGPNFYKFSDQVRYELAIDNDGDALEDVVYQWDFKTVVGDPETFLYNVNVVDQIDDNDLNVKQFYTLTKLDKKKGVKKIVAKNVPVAPWNVGDASFPNNTYEQVALQAVTQVEGARLFAGPRAEPFFVDLGVFDLLAIQGNLSTDGLNIMSLVLEVPITEVAKDGVRPAAGTNDKESLIGVHARSLRRQVRILNRAFIKNGDVKLTKGKLELNVGALVQVSRLGLPLVNEVVLPIGDKDVFNRTTPPDEVVLFGDKFLDPELPKLLNAVLGLDCNIEGNRTDIIDIISPNGTATADLLRLNIEDGQTFENSSFPNGRKLQDDVVDILLTVFCGGGFPVSDGVDLADLSFVFSDNFPFLATPFSGNVIAPPAP
ncbi:MAG: DUF4331 domain-containing protein [Myxococcales bacterium]|nr:DUF4331 domain-containing protein [Myxococcales bacterium]